MMNIASGGRLTCIHREDLHITGEDQAHYRDCLALVATINTRLAGHKCWRVCR